MKTYKLLLACVGISLATVSCSERFFELLPANQVPTDKVYKTADDFNMAVLGCYAKLQTQVSFYTELCEFRSDNLYLSAPTTGTQDRYDIDQFQDKSTNAILDDAWANFNNAVYRCNMVLDRIDGATFDQKLKDQYKGEALFMRAFNYFNMYRSWGGVPTTTRVVSVSEALKIGRSSEEQMFDLISGDLRAIIDQNLLPDAYTGADAGRISSGAAKTLLGKVYLTFHKWTEARDILSQVIGKYTLMTQPAQIFDVNNKLNSEIIFAVRFNKSVVGEGHGYWYTIANLTDDSNQSPALRACYTDPKDLRREMIDYVKVEGEASIFVIKKFYDVKDPSTKNTGNDQIILRYADVLLMYAEALNELGFSNDAASLQMVSLNAVHTRAGLDPLTAATLTDKVSFRKALMLERQQEFPYEGHRWFDLVRMGGVREAMLAQKHDIQDYQLLFPIPKPELERINNTSLLWQNPGY